MPEVMFMKTRRSVIFDDELTERIQNFANNSGYILNLQTAVLKALCEKGQLSRRQFDICADKLKNR